MVDIGDKVWVPHEEQAWLCGTVIKLTPSDAEISTEMGNIKMSSNQVQLLDHCGSHIDATIDNLVDLDELSEGAILHHTRKRFQKKVIYTHVGAILVAVNPFERLNIYGEDEIRKASNVVNSYPHIFITASAAYQQLRLNLKNQSVLISGESGAGKTETTKKVLNYLANVAPGIKSKQNSEPGIEEKILQSNPLLEALGNAKTLRNNNSSRFGKWMKVNFDHNFRIQGCEIVNYLLEKSRIVSQSTGERNYHMFYQLLAGANDEFKARCQLLPCENYAYLNSTGCYTIDGVDDASDFTEVKQAMDTLQFSTDIQNQILLIIAAVLWIGNISFSAGKAEGSSEVNSSAQQAMEISCDMLGLQIDSFKYALTEKRVQVGRGSVVSIKLNPSQALDSKDTLAKALYSNMFDWIILKVNDTLKTQSAPFTIGILDIFGFEVFEVNSFEQLCINYANEKLQFHFNEVIFNEEMKMYSEEGVPSEEISFVDNGQCVALIENKPMGLLSLLDEECSLGKATDLTYASKIEQVFGKDKKCENRFFTKHRTRPEAFTVHHFAGPVEYVVTNFLEKNRDTLSITLHEVAALSSLSLVADLFAGEPDGGSGSKRRSTVKSTLAGQFRNQVVGLVSSLGETEPHFVRCVKPNHQKKPGIFDGQLALRQLRYAGLFEAIRIRQSGFAYRVTHGAFARQFVTLVDGLSLRLQSNTVSEADAAQIILDDASKNGILDRRVWCVGRTKVFIKANQDRLQLERQRIKRVEVFAIRIQAFARSSLIRLKLYEKKHARLMEAKKEAIRQEKVNVAAETIQKIIRGFLVRKSMLTMGNLVNLRRELDARNVEGIEVILQSISKEYEGEVISSVFKREIDIAKAMVKLIRLQDKCVKDMDNAIATENVEALNHLLAKSIKLDMSTHPSVGKARIKLDFLNKKRSVMRTLMDFLKHENGDICELVPEALKLAKELEVDADFVAKVQRIYENASPRLRARNKLRRAIETIDKSGIEESMVEISSLQEHFPGFGEMELRSARSLLKMLEFEEQLAPVQNDEGMGRLTDEVLSICHEICANKGDKASMKALRAKLAAVAVSREQLELYIRLYKWSKVYCTWKYPEIVDIGRQRSEESVCREEEGEFYGLRPADARSSIYVIRSLHMDVDMILGNTPASVQAALGALHLSPTKAAPVVRLNKQMEKRDQQEQYVRKQYDISSPHKSPIKTPTKKSSHTSSPSSSVSSGSLPSSASPKVRASRTMPSRYSSMGSPKYRSPKMSPSKTSPSVTPRRSPKVVMKGSTPTIKSSEKKENKEGRRTSYICIDPDLEERLMESRASLEEQKAVVEQSRMRHNKDKKGEWH